MNKYQYTYVKINPKGQVVSPGMIGTWHQVPIIGHNTLSSAAVLLPDFCVGDEITLYLLKRYNIDPKYLGLKMALIHESYLKHDGLICDCCNDYYEHLGSIYYDFFQCWKCQL